MRQCDNSHDRALVKKWLTQFGPSESFELVPQDQKSAIIEKATGGKLAEIFGELPDSFAQLPRPIRGLFLVTPSFPRGKSVMLVSSRLGRSPDRQKHIFDAIRTYCSRLDPNRHFLISHSQMSLHKYLMRAADLFQIPIVEFRALPNQSNNHFLGTKETNIYTQSMKAVCFYRLDKDDVLQSKPSVDQWMCLLPHELRVLKATQNGNTICAVKNRLKTTTNSVTFFLVEDGNSTNDLNQLSNSSAVPWYLFGHESNEKSPNSIPSRVYSLQKWNSHSEGRNWLLHWTRRRQGPWPDQNEHDYLDDLILGNFGAAHDRISSLVRILAMQKLVASADTIRGDQRVVCFTAQKLSEMKRLRKFRQHRGRWDFETLGIGIDAEWLKELGAKPVIYGDEQVWTNLKPEQKPWYQKLSSHSIDWEDEQEWRIIGNVNLRNVPLEKAFIYVSNAKESEHVRHFSRYPVVVLS